MTAMQEMQEHQIHPGLISVLILDFKLLYRLNKSELIVKQQIQGFVM